MSRTWIVCLFFLAVACSGSTQHAPVSHGEPRLLPLTPKSLGRSLSLSQMVTGHFDRRKYRMRIEVDVTPVQLTIVGLSPLGVTLFTLVQEEGKPIIVTRGRQRLAFDPRHILFDLHATYWPTETLRDALATQSLRLSDDAKQSVRHIFSSDGKRIAKVSYAPVSDGKNHIAIQHFDIPYRLSIESKGVRTPQ